jgi:hypothetical protein
MTVNFVRGRLPGRSPGEHGAKHNPSFAPCLQDSSRRGGRVTTGASGR